MTTKNPYKVFGDYLIDLTKGDSTTSEIVSVTYNKAEDGLRKPKNEGYESWKDYEESQA